MQSRVLYLSRRVSTEWLWNIKVHAMYSYFTQFSRSFYLLLLTFHRNHLNEKVTRLPCAHIFHTKCLVDWLTNHHCTCPVCRYELPTDDPRYEAGRMERMKARKPRFAMYELQRMSVPKLLQLNKRPAPGILEKRDLIQTLIDQDHIHLIPAPEPVEYKLETLQVMGVSQLKRTMEDAGVFFHPKDVVEKSDMLTIFHNSGRLVLISEPEEQEEEITMEDVSQPTPEPSIFTASTTSTLAPETASHFATRGPVVETVTEGSDDECETKETSKKEFTSPVQDMFGLYSNEELLSPSAATELNSVPTDHSPSASTPVHPYTPPTTRSQSAATGNLNVPHDESDTPPSIASEENAYASASPDAIVQPDESSAQLDAPVAVSNGIENGNAENDQDQITPPSGDTFYDRASGDLAASAEENTDDSYDGADADSESNSSRKRQRPLPGVSRRARNDSEYSHAASRNGDEAIPFRDCTISELQAIARDSNADLTHCFERHEMVQLLIANGIQNPKQIQLTSENFSDWSVSQLRALASAADVDLSHCSDREEMLYNILHEANHERPHLRNYLRALSPLAKSTLPQLKGVAREWRVNISDCLEKEEIIQRLITRGQRFAAC